MLNLHPSLLVRVQFILSFRHQEGAVAGCNTLTTTLAVLYTIIAGGILTGHLDDYVRNVDTWRLSLCTSSVWLGAVYIQSAMVSHGYVGQVSTAFHSMPGSYT